MASFQQFALPDYLQEAIAQKFTKPTPIQERVIPAVLKDKSVIGEAGTGTGKTHAFLIPLFAKIKSDVAQVQALVVSPTRELAKQIHQMAQELNRLCPQSEQINIRLLMGGTDQNRTFNMSKKTPQLVIGTPARLKSYIEQDILPVFEANTLVVDEADLLIDLGFMEIVDFIAASMNNQLQMLVFSATVPLRLQPFLKKYMENPSHIVAWEKQQKKLAIEHILVPLRHHERLHVVKQLLKALNPYLAIVFVNSKKNANLYYEKLQAEGLNVGLLTGALPMRQRQQVMKNIRALKYQYIVATDLAARGIDIIGVSHVINAELPQDLDFYIHRVGRTGRASYTGTAFTVFSETDENQLVLLEKRGVVFSYQDIKGGELTSAPHRHERKYRKKAPPVSNEQSKQWKPKTTTVKPNHKKKQLIELKHKQKRERYLGKRQGKK